MATFKKQLLFTTILYLLYCFFLFYQKESKLINIFAYVYKFNSVPSFAPCDTKSVADVIFVQLSFAPDVGGIICISGLHDTVTFCSYQKYFAQSLYALFSTDCISCCFELTHLCPVIPIAMVTGLQPHLLWVPFITRNQSLMLEFMSLLLPFP